ncbi:MAG: putative iron-sulfur protein [Ilumatobacteraceae bacterium]|nr:putative iron-sulfur protein [Ilumatobacteraceae bacterium]
MNEILCGNSAFEGAWYAVARSVEVGATPSRITLLSRDVVLYRSASGAVVAAPDRCPHREAPLSKGTVQAGCLVCPYHGWTFGDDGRCVDVPSANDGVPPPPRAHLHTYHATERYGLVWVCLADEPAAPIPNIAQEHDHTFRRINTEVEIWRTSATRMVDNFLDITHFPYVHVGTFGRAQDTKAPKIELVALDDDWFGYEYEVLANNSDLGTLASGQSSGVVERAMATGFNLPFSVRSDIHYGTGLSHTILLLSTPIDDVTSYFTFVIWRNDDFSVSAEEVIRFDLAIGAEDKRMLEMLDGVLPLDQTTLVSVQADKCSVEWRRRLIEWMSRPPAVSLERAG